jgi:hypothetical protein
VLKGQRIGAAGPLKRNFSDVAEKTSGHVNAALM